MPMRARSCGFLQRLIECSVESSLKKTTNPHNLKIYLLLFVFNLLRSFGAMSPVMSLDENFLLIWRRFLEMEIIRSQHCLKLAGSANAYLILQVICWHHFLLVSEDLEETSIDATLEGWVALSKRPGGKGKKLTYALIADLTGLDKETVRRNVKLLSGRGFVTADRKQGVVFSPTDKRNDEIVNVLNSTERRLVLQFAETLERYGRLPALQD